MSDQEKMTYPPEQLFEYARGNLNGFLFTTMELLKKHNLPIAEFWASAGHHFAPLWEKGITALDFAKIQGMNIASTGGNIESLSGDALQAELVVSGWPPPDHLVEYGVNLEEALTVVDTIKPIAKHLELDYEWHAQGDKVTLSFKRKV